MATISQCELCDNVGEILRRAEMGERIVVTVDDRPVAECGPLSDGRPVATVGALRACGPADGAWVADQERLRVEDRGGAVDPWA